MEKINFIILLILLQYSVVLYQIIRQKLWKRLIRLQFQTITNSIVNGLGLIICFASGYLTNEYDANALFIFFITSAIFVTVISHMILVDQKLYIKAVTNLIIKCDDTNQINEILNKYSDSIKFLDDINSNVHQ